MSIKTINYDITRAYASSKPSVTLFTCFVFENGIVVLEKIMYKTYLVSGREVQYANDPFERPDG